MQALYAEQVSVAFRASNPEQFGDSRATGAEFSALKKLHAWNGRNREATLADIMTNGYPAPDEITPDMVAIAGAAHACGVTEQLASLRGEEGMDSTYDSYTTKNQFDRFVRLHLPEGLREEWEAPIDREIGFINGAVRYPEGVDDTKIHGGALPHRFLPAQTMRYLEFARLGKLDEDTKVEFGITDKTDIDRFNVEWETLVPAIQSATNLVDLAGNIASEIRVQLRESGLPEDQITAVINKGYDAQGMINEHGNVAAVQTISDVAKRD